MLETECETREQGEPRGALARLLALSGGGIWVFVLAHLSHHLCTGILVPLLPLIRDQFSLNYFMTGLMVSVFNLAYGIAQIPMGRLADRRSKRLLIVVGLIGLALGTFVTGLSQNYYLMLAFLIMIGVLGGTYHPAASPLLVEIVPLAQRGRALGLHLIGGSSSFFIAPLLAGLIAQALGWRGAYLLLALPALVMALVFWRLTRKQSSTSPKPVSATGSTATGLREVVRVVGVLIVLTVMSQIVFSSVTAFLPLYLVDKLGVPPTYAGMLVGLIYGAGILGAPLGGMLSDRIGRKPVIMMSVAAAGPLLYLLTLLSFGPLLLGTIVLMGFAVTFKTAVMESLIADVVPRERLSSVMGVYYFLSQEVNGLSAPIAGYLMDVLGLNTVFTMLAVLAVVASGLVFLIRGKA